MRKALTPLVLFFISPIVFAQTGHSPYTGQEQRKIKALSEKEVQAYLAGEGMGLAKAAELNQYPGPRHVMELAKELDLSKEQLDKTQEIYKQMHSEAVRLGKLIVEREKQLDDLYATQKIDENQLHSLVSEIARLQGALRVVHLEAHLEMKKILTPQQVEKYGELRGYGKGTTPHQHGKH
jgi:Spy/CpxP family protein refolding chaperone